MYAYAQFLSGKNSLNSCSLKYLSTIFTFLGFVSDPGTIDSTNSFSRLQDVASLNFVICGVRGSADNWPHIVPEHVFGNLGGGLAEE